MAAYITEAQLASYLQVTIPDGAAEVTVGLANDAVTDVIGDITDWETIPARVRSVALEAAARHWRNPQGYSSVQRKLDDFDTTERREGDALVAPGVYVTPEEEDALLRAVFGNAGRSRVGSIRLRVKDAH